MDRIFRDNLYYTLVKVFMKNIILSKLNEQRMGGYELMKFFNEKYKIPISAGTIYSCLHSMERRRLIEANCNEDKRVFRLTAKGKQLLEEFRKSKRRIMNLTEKLLMDI